MTADQTLSTISLAILGLISEQPRSGYDVRKTFSTTPMGHFCASPGAIYPALKRMEKSGWIRGKAENKNSLRPKLMYTLTKMGREVLKQHVLQTVTRDDVVWRLDDLLLRFAFMGKLVGHKKTVSFLEEFLTEIEAHVLSLEQYLKGVQEDMPLHGVLAMENGIESYVGHARWARRASKQLRRKR